MFWLQLIAARLAGLRTRLADRRGTVAVLFAISVVPLAMVVGLATDYSFYVKVQSQLNLAADTAAMQAVRVASEVNGNGMTTAQFQAAVQNAGQQAGQEWFKAQMGNLDQGSVPDSNIAVTVGYTASPRRFTSNVSYTGTVPTNFGALFNLSRFNIAGTASAVISNDYVEVLMLLDNSSSMLIPSTTADISRLEAATPCSAQAGMASAQAFDMSQYTWNYTSGYGYNAPYGSPPPVTPVNGSCNPGYTGDPSACQYPPSMPNIDTSNTWSCTNKGGKATYYNGQTHYLAQAPCAFACHTDASGNDLYGLARSLSPAIQLRLDVVQQAAANVITTLQNQPQQANQFTVGVYSFNDALSAVWPTSGEATSDLATTLQKTSAMTTPITSDTGNTNFVGAIQSLNAGVSVAGDGSLPGAPLKNLFIVTDGMEDTSSSAGPMTSATDEQLCSLFWAKGFTVYVLYTPYLPLPVPSYLYNNPVYKNFAEPQIAGQDSQNVAALKACARSPSNFFQASDPAAINSAMQTMLAAALNSPGRVSH